MPLPERLGRLQRVSRLGSGGFATVWLYRDETLDSLVAVKALAENWATRTDVSERFLEEARMLRRADSDHVVRVYDIGENEERPYFVMSYADQGTVADLITRAPRPPEEVADVVWQTAQGLAVLHRMGVVHRDVKPQNLLLQSVTSAETRLVVADLGVAKALAFASGLTLVVGTPEYMAPEQVDPAAGVDARADIHALAAVAYHLLTGKPVRSGGFESVINPSAPAPPSMFAPNVSRALDQVVTRALSIDRERRHPDVLTFASEFGQATYARPERGSGGQGAGGGSTSGVETPTAVGLPAAGAFDTTQPPPSGSQRLPGAQGGGTGRPPRRWAPVALAAVVIVLAAFGGYWLATRDGDADRSATKDPPVSSPSTTEPSGQVALALPAAWTETERDGRTVTYRDLSRDLLARVSATPSADPVQTVAETELDRVSAAAGYHLIASRQLPSDQRPGWDEGWSIEYGYVIDGQRRVQRAWYVGDEGGTSGFVAVAAPAGELPTVTHVLPKALGSLPH